MTEKQILGKIKQYAELTKQLQILYKELSEHYFFEDLMGWGTTEIYPNCEIKDGCLYSSDGNLLSGDDGCMDEKIPYFVNQSTGYFEDAYYGTMYVKVDDNNTFVAIDYSW